MTWTVTKPMYVVWTVHRWGYQILIKLLPLIYIEYERIRGIHSFRSGWVLGFTSLYSLRNAMQKLSGSSCTRSYRSSQGKGRLVSFWWSITHLFLTCGASRAFPAPSAAVPVGQDAAAQGMPYHSTGSALSGDVFTKRNLSKNFGIQGCFKDILKKKMKYLHQLWAYWI